MKYLLGASLVLASDMASTLVFLAILLISKNVVLAAVLGMGLGVAQIGWEFARKAPIDLMQWMSLFLVLASGAATLLTHDPRFVMIKPSLIYAIVGIVMLKPGWMLRYLPPIAVEVVSDVAVVFGFVWAGLMFVSAGLSLVAALTLTPVAWGAFMSIYAIVSKTALFLVQFTVMRFIALKRRRRITAEAAPA